jgi:hypothetical protein
MRPHLLPRSARPLLPVLALSIAVMLNACGGDEEPAPADPVPAVDDDRDPLADGVDDALGDASLDLIASAVDSALGSVDGYEVEGDAITLLDDGSSVDPTLVCAVAGTTLSSFDVPDGTTLTVQYPDGSSEECAL